MPLKDFINTNSGQFRRKFCPFFLPSQGISLITLLIPLWLLTTSGVAATVTPDEILGKWMAEEGNLLVQVFRERQEFRAKILWFNDSDDKSKPMHMRTDEQNPDPLLRTRKILGMEVLNSLRYNNKNHHWEEGFIYDASSGRTWNASISLAPNGLLKVKGFWHFEFIGKTMIFKRVTD